MTAAGPERERPLVLGHRGASAEAPENTLAAFRLALAQGADGVELDVWRCGTGEVVVHHDLDLGRTARVPIRLTDAPLSALRRLDVGAWRSERFRGERIPLLAEVLEALPGAVVNVELKSTRRPDPALPGAVARLVRAAHAEDRCILSSFHPALLAIARVVAPALRRGTLFADERGWRLRERLGLAAGAPSAVHPEASLVDAARVRAWRARGLAVNVWTVDEGAEVERLARLGVSALITNRPAAALEALRRAAVRG